MDCRNQVSPNCAHRDSLPSLASCTVLDSLQSPCYSFRPPASLSQPFHPLPHLSRRAGNFSSSIAPLLDRALPASLLELTQSAPTMAPSLTPFGNAVVGAVGGVFSGAVVCVPLALSVRNFEDVELTAKRPLADTLSTRTSRGSRTPTFLFPDPPANSLPSSKTQDQDPHPDRTPRNRGSDRQLDRAPVAQALERAAPPPAPTCDGEADGPPHLQGGRRARVLPRVRSQHA